MDTIRYLDRHCLVTGGAKGLGFGITKEFLAQGATTVEIWDYEKDALAEAMGKLGKDAAKVVPVHMDISKPDQVQASMNALVTRTGQLDIVVNSAGIVGLSNVTIDQYPPEEYLRVMSTNAFGAFLVASHAIRVMKPKNFGRILLIASIAGKEGNPGMPAYSASKAAVIATAKGASLEVAQTGITVNAVAPCTILTDMVAGMAPEAVAMMKSKIPAGRLGEVEEFAYFVASICDPKVTGVNGFCYDHSLGRARY